MPKINHADTPMVTLQPTSVPNSQQLLDSFIAMNQNPNDFEAIFNMADALRQAGLFQASNHYLLSQPEVVQIIQERYLAPVPDLDVLLTYPPDSLGYGFASHMKATNLDPEFYRKVLVQDDMSYIALRFRQTHDLYHVITGFGIDQIGEIGLQAFQLAQMRSPLPIAIIASSLVNYLSSTEHLNRLINAVYHGWHMGLNARPFLAQKWEEHWERPLADWRSALGIQPVSGTFDQPF